ncbi:MAG: glycosyltransferase family 9 protein [Acidobacteria bacterium]|nr:glycosyltransferase family 9 protein [Acidobacteriota bacterium]
MSWLSDAIKVADVLVGRPACVGLGLLPRARRRPAAPAEPRRILVIRPGGIGDAVLFIPMLQHLRKVWPDVQIDLLAERRNAGVVTGTGLFAEVLLYDKFPGGLARALRGRYDLVIDTEQYHCLSAVVAFLTGAPRRVGFGTNVRRRMLTDELPYDQEVYEVYSFLELARVATGREPEWDPQKPFYPLNAQALDYAGRVLAPLGERPIVAIHPGASIPQRRWDPQRYAALARMLAERGCGVVVLGAASDAATAGLVERSLAGLPAVNVAGRCNLLQAAAIVSRVAVYISADSGVLHLAYAVGTPTVHLFGPGVLSKWGPPGSRFRTIAAPVPCSPCTRYGYTPPCCQGVVCMERITPEQVLAAVELQLAGRDTPLRRTGQP